MAGRPGGNKQPRSSEESDFSSSSAETHSLALVQKTERLKAGINIDPKGATGGILARLQIGKYGIPGKTVHSR
jgi:hypothetical protein